MAKHDPLVSFRQRDFRIYCISLFVYGVSQMMLPAVIALHVFDLTDSEVKLGLLGLVRIVPALVLALPAGAVADRFDRRTVSQVAQCGAIACTLLLAVLSLQGSISYNAIVGVVFLLALGTAFDFPARGALLPMLVDRETLPNAITVSGTVRQLGFVSGPPLGAAIIGWLGYDAAYLADAVLVSISAVTLFFLHPRNDAPRRAISFASIKEGISFVRSRHIILGCMTLDMFAVIFGGATALLPVYAKDILEISKLQTGVLYASLDVGALMMSVFLIMAPPARRPGIWLMWAVLAFGLFTMGFGLSRSFPLSILFYGLIGMADQVSVVMRNTTIQLNTPDELRGRVSSVNSIFISSSNQIGQAESGLVAGVTSATFAVVSGGIGCITVLGAVFAFIPEMRRYVIGSELEGQALEPVAAPKRQTTT